MNGAGRQIIGAERLVFVMGRTHPLVPSTGAIGVVMSDSRGGKPCKNRNNPFGHSRECPCGWWADRQRASQVVPYYPESLHGEHLEDMEDIDDPEYRAARHESDALDAEIDRMREERHFDY